jgi:hypothetical protein
MHRHRDDELVQFVIRSSSAHILLNLHYKHHKYSTASWVRRESVALMITYKLSCYGLYVYLPFSSPMYILCHHVLPHMFYSSRFIILTVASSNSHDVSGSMRNNRLLPSPNSYLQNRSIMADRQLTTHIRR